MGNISLLEPVDMIMKYNLSHLDLASFSHWLNWHRHALVCYMYSINLLTCLVDYMDYSVIIYQQPYFVFFIDIIVKHTFLCSASISTAGWPHYTCPWSAIIFSTKRRRHSTHSCRRRSQSRWPENSKLVALFMHNTACRQSWRNRVSV